MKVTSVKGCNFLTLGSVQFDLADKGLVLVQGRNLDDSAADSNGSGKSSLMDLVCWTLWGATARGSSGDAVIRDGSKEASGELTLWDGDAKVRWDVARSRKKGKTTLKLNSLTDSGDGVDHTLGTEKLTQDRIAQVVGCTEEVFRASVYMGQEALVDLPRMTDKQLKVLVEEAAGVTALEAAYDRAKALHNETLTRREQTGKAIISVEGELATNARLQERESELRAEWERVRGERVREAERRYEEAVAKLPMLSESATASILSIESLKEQVRLRDVILASHVPERARESELSDVLSKAQFDLARRATALRTAITAFNTERTTLADIGTRIGEPCRECGTPMTEGHVSVARKGAQHRLSLARATAIAEREAHTGAVGVAAQARDALQRHRDAMHDPSETAREHAELSRALRDGEARLERVRRDRETVALLRDELETEGKSRSNPHLVHLEKLKIENARWQESLRLAQHELAVHDVSVEHHAQAVKVFAPSGVRAHILDTVTPYLNVRTSEYLGVLSDGVIGANWTTLVRNAKGELREKFAVEVTHASGDRGFNELSGGEKRKVRLATAMALQDLVASRATKSFQLAIFDEIDHALDDSGLERLTTVLQAKAAVSGTVVVISHNAMDSYVPNVWTVTKQDGKSTLETA